MNLSLNLVIKHLAYIKMHRSIGNQVVGRVFFGVVDISFFVGLFYELVFVPCCCLPF
jgi:hypothetical protein